MKKANDGWTEIGEVMVDSATVMLVDPCYVLPGTQTLHEEGLSYETAVGLDKAVWLDANGKPAPRFTDVRQGGRWAETAGDPMDKARLAHDKDAAAFALPRTPGGFLIPSGFGDGLYPVSVRYDEESGRVAAVRIDFIG